MTLRRQTTTNALVWCALFAVGCSGSSTKKSTLGGGSGSTDGTADGSELPGASTVKKPDRQLSADAKGDFRAASKYFSEREQAGWNSSSCKSAAKRFISVAKDHKKLVEARFNAGVAYERCKMTSEAEGQYKAALKISKHGPSLSNLARLAHLQGNVTRARKLWNDALEADSKITAARNNLAWLMLQKLRKGDTAGRKALKDKIRLQLSSALAVDTENVQTHTLYALYYIEGAKQNRDQLSLAKLHLDEAEKAKADYAYLHNVRGLYHMARDNLGRALASFQRAVSLQPDLLEARMNVGSITLNFRKYQVAFDQFNTVVKSRTKDYDALIGRGKASRGLKQLDKAEADYKAAHALNKRRGTALFNLGVLYKEFRAARATNLKQSKGFYETALKYFQDFARTSGISKADKREAEDNIDDCKRNIRTLKQSIKIMENAKKTP